LSTKASEALRQLKTAWGRLSPTQRWLGSGLLLALLFATGLAYHLNQPDWVVLVSQADPKDAAAVVARLQELKVPYQPSGDGYTILVPQSEQYTAKLALAQAGLPKGSSVGMELFDEPKFGTTDFERRVNYLRAQQGELERALVRINEVEYANVKLAIPDQSVFTQKQQPVTAAVMLQLRSGRRLSPDQVSGVVDFVSNAVQGLSPENVRVVDQSGRLLSGTANGTNGLGLDQTGDQLQRQLTLQQDMEQRVQSLLEPIFGAGNVVARVSVTLNLDASRIESQTVGNSTPKSVEVTRESAQGTALDGTGGQSAPSQGAPGTPPVYQGQTGPSAGPSDEYRMKTTTQYDVSQRKEVTVVAPGSVKKLTVGIAINRASLSPDQVKQIQETVAGATGADLPGISVAAMAFNKEAQPAPAATATQPKVTPLLIGGVAALLLVLLGAILSRRRQQEEPDSLVDAQPAAGETVGRTLDVALGVQPAEPAPVEEPAVPDGRNPAEVRARAAAVIRAKPKRQLHLDDYEPDPEIQLLTDDLIDTSPEASAEVLRQWLKGGG
jgi:flagellar M-ring protein FliF